MAAELIAAPSGLGYLLQEGRRYFLTDQVMMIIVVIGVCACLMDRLFRAHSGTPDPLVGGTKLMSDIVVDRL